MHDLIYVCYGKMIEMAICCSVWRKQIQQSLNIGDCDSDGHSEVMKKITLMKKWWQWNQHCWQCVGIHLWQEQQWCCCSCTDLIEIVIKLHFGKYKLTILVIDSQRAYTTYKWSPQPSFLFVLFQYLSPQARSSKKNGQTLLQLARKNCFFQLIYSDLTHVEIFTVEKCFFYFKFGK